LIVESDPVNNIDSYDGVNMSADFRLLQGSSIDPPNINDFLEGDPGQFFNPNSANNVQDSDTHSMIDDFDAIEDRNIDFNDNNRNQHVESNCSSYDGCYDLDLTMTEDSENNQDYVLIRDNSHRLLEGEIVLSNVVDSIEPDRYDIIADDFHNIRNLSTVSVDNDDLFDPNIDEFFDKNQLQAKSNTNSDAYTSDEWVYPNEFIMDAAKSVYMDGSMPDLMT
jgi:hypothetical protein